MRQLPVLLVVLLVEVHRRDCFPAERRSCFHCQTSAAHGRRRWARARRPWPSASTASDWSQRGRRGNYLVRGLDFHHQKWHYRRPFRGVAASCRGRPSWRSWWGSRRRQRGACHSTGASPAWRCCCQSTGSRGLRRRWWWNWRRQRRRKKLHGMLLLLKREIEIGGDGFYGGGGDYLHLH